MKKEKSKTPRPVIKMKGWAYFCPDGHVQVRTIAPTKKLAREMICKFEEFKYTDYENKGYICHKIEFTIKPVNV